MVGPLTHSHTQMSESPAPDHAREEQQPQPPAQRDDGLRKLLTWTFIALVISVVMAMIAVSLVIKVFDPGISP
jgi:hypothetical protein